VTGSPKWLRATMQEDPNWPGRPAGRTWTTTYCNHFYSLRFGWGTGPFHREVPQRWVDASARRKSREAATLWRYCTYGDVWLHEISSVNVALQVRPSEHLHGFLLPVSLSGSFVQEEKSRKRVKRRSSEPRLIYEDEIRSVAETRRSGSSRLASVRFR